MPERIVCFSSTAIVCRKSPGWHVLNLSGFTVHIPWNAFLRCRCAVSVACEIQLVSKQCGAAEIHGDGWVGRVVGTSRRLASP